MRSRVLLLALTSVLMSLCVPAFAQRPNDSIMAIVDSVYQKYLQGEATMLDVMRCLPGVDIPEGDESQYTVNGPPRRLREWKGASGIETSDPQIHLPDSILYRLPEPPFSTGAQQGAEKIRGAFIIGFDSTLTVSKSWLEADNNHYDTTTFKLPAGLSVMELISKLPGVKIGDDGIITAIGGKPVIQLLFDWTQIYPKYQPLIEDLKSEALQYPDKYILDKGGVIVQIVDQKFYDDIDWLSAPDNLSEGGVKITITYHPTLEVVEDGYIINGKKVTKIMIVG